MEGKYNNDCDDNGYPLWSLAICVLCCITNNAWELLSSFYSLLYVLSRQNDQSEGTSVQPGAGGSSNAVADEENDMFWGLDDIAGS